MSFERTKIQQLAQKFLAKGQVDKAITEFQRIVKHDPTDTRTWLKIGDLYTRGGQNREAIQAYEKVADYYSQQGIYRKAVAVYSQILKLDNTRINVQRRLADAYDKLGLSSDAVTTYEKCAQAYMKAAQVDPALEVYEAILKLDPVHIAAHVACGELLSAKGQKEQACPHFEKAAWELKKLGRFDEFVKVSERLLYHNEDYQDISRALARVYLSRNQAQLALAKLQPCYQRNSKDCETLELLAQTFAVLEQVSMSASIYQEAARLYAEQKNYEGEARMWRALRELDTDNAAATARLNELRSQRLIKDEPAVPDILPEVPDDYLTEDISEEISVETNGLIDDNEGDSQGGVIFFDEEPDKTAAEVSQVEVAEAVAAANGTADPMDGRRETVQLDTDSDDASGAAQDPLTLGAERSSSSIIGDLELVLEHVQELIAGGQVRAAQQILLQAKRDFPTNMLVKEAEIEIASLIRSRKRSGSFPKVNIVYREGPSLADKIAKELRSSRPPQALGSVALDAKKEFAGVKQMGGAEVGIADSDTHFDLGIAYKEMGLIDDAIREFELSTSNPQRECMANTMIGLCYMERGDVEQAIRYFKRGLYADVRTDQEELGLYYELGCAYERTDDRQEAMYYFQKVQKRDAHFRKVEEKVAALKKLGTLPKSDD